MCTCQQTFHVADSFWPLVESSAIEHTINVAELAVVSGDSLDNLSFGLNKPVIPTTLADCSRLPPPLVKSSTLSGRFSKSPDLLVFEVDEAFFPVLFYIELLNIALHPCSLMVKFSCCFYVAVLSVTKIP